VGLGAGLLGPELLGWFGLFSRPIAPVRSKDARADVFGERLGAPVWGKRFTEVGEEQGPVVGFQN